ncbi:MAG: hypothetical protein JST39_04055, partial [Bacteroidetes bacterium]|nr:hypothetical protein [Bacteroidota bacterium]
RVLFNGYDSNGNLAEQQKLNDANSDYIYDYQKSFPIAESIGGDTSIAYTSFEADGSGNWSIGSVQRDSSTGAITGTRSYNLSNGSISRVGLTVGRHYILSYWSNTGAKTITGGTGSVSAGRKVGIWTYYEHALTISSSTITVSGTGNIDELRLFPQGAKMTTYCYTPLIGVCSVADPNGEITYYEYDGLNRLKNIKDYLGNIVKNFQYNYLNSCGANCVVLPMQTFAGSNTLSYPVGVFNINGKLLGNASSQSAYVSLWMSDTANSHTGTLTAGDDSMHFRLSLASGRYPPPAVTGLRYWQCDLAYTVIDAVRNVNGAYVDFGDGTGMRLGQYKLDTTMVLAPNTTKNYFTNNTYAYLKHTYPDSSLKTLTFYHNDSYDYEGMGFDNFSNPATSLTKLKNFRGYLPQYNTGGIGGSCLQDSTFNT